MRGVATNVYSRKTSKKPKRPWSAYFENEGSGVVFMHGEGISTLRVRHMGRQPLIECANHDFRIYVFSLFMLFYVFLLPFYVFHFFVVYKGVSLAPTYSSIVMKKSDLHSSLRELNMG